MILHIMCVQIKKKKKRSTYRPSQFSGQKSKQTFYFLGLNCNLYLQLDTLFKINPACYK